MIGSLDERNLQLVADGAFDDPQRDLDPHCRIHRQAARIVLSRAEYVDAGGRLGILARRIRIAAVATESIAAASSPFPAGTTLVDRVMDAEALFGPAAVVEPNDQAPPEDLH